AGIAAAVAFGAAGVLLAGYDDLPDWSFPVLVALGTLLVEWQVYAGGRGAAAYAVLLALPAAYAAHFFRKVPAALELALVVGGYAAAARLGPHIPGAEVAVTAASLAAAGGLVGMQRANVNRLIWRLSDAAVTDALTGLLNRRGFQELFETELERARRSGQPLTLLVGDLDHFKAVNDRFGHGAGDEVLERV